MASNVTLNDVLEWFGKKELNYNLNESEGWIHTALSGKNTQLEAFVRCQLDHDFIGCRVYYPLRVPENKRIDVCELITRINCTYALPSCIMNISTGEVSWQSYVLIAAADFQSDQFGHAFYLALQVADMWFPAFMTVVYGGKSAEMAVEQTEASFVSSSQDAV